jgi:hypothetical protein
MLPRVQILHSLPGRTRLGLLNGKGDQALLEKVVSGLKALPEVVQVAGNPVTGTILLHHNGSFDSIAQQTGSLFSLAPKVQPQRAVIQTRATHGLDQLSKGLESVTGGQVDLNGLLIVTFTLLAIQQAIEGQVMIPAATALWYALNASRSPSTEREEQTKNQNEEGGMS